MAVLHREPALDERTDSRAVQALTRIVSILGAASAAGGRSKLPSPAERPAITADGRPWARWLWHVSVEDRPEITRQLESFHRAALGEVDVSPT